MSTQRKPKARKKPAGPPMTNKQFDRSLILATMPRFDGYDHQRWEWWSEFNFKRYGRHLVPYWGDAACREPDYRSPEYPGHADERKGKAA
jgi:hypothetical protein